MSENIDCLFLIMHWESPWRLFRSWRRIPLPTLLFSSVILPPIIYSRDHTKACPKKGKKAAFTPILACRLPTWPRISSMNSASGPSVCKTLSRSWQSHLHAASLPLRRCKNFWSGAAIRRTCQLKVFQNIFRQLFSLLVRLATSQVSRTRETVPYPMFLQVPFFSFYRRLDWNCSWGFEVGDKTLLYNKNHLRIRKWRKPPISSF